MYVNKIYYKSFILLFLLFNYSCVNKHFEVYSISGNNSINNNHYNFSNRADDFEIIFDREMIGKEFVEFSIIKTDYYYYGQFFFDENFMKMLKSKALDIGSDALIYEKNRTDFSNYDKNFLYFTAIKYQNIK